MESQIPTVYNPEEIEPRWARAWVERKLYRPSDDPSLPRFCLVIPPPNITGSLHMGHMLEHTEIDILMRWRRMSGDAVLWLPGTDHASIATQMIVERELGREALPDLAPGKESVRIWQREGQRLRMEMGREKFVARCWEWKEQNGGAIKRQMERLGASCDWTRERFTMDAAYSRSVVEAFVRLYDEGLIYRGEYIVNWCARCGTAISDLEVAHEDRQGKLWFIRYPLEGGQESITVATTRPETMLGDTAVAVNPADRRYQRLIGRKVTLPLVGRLLPIIADEFVDPAFGTGAVKVTPAHDSNDFAMALRHDLPRVAVIGSDTHMTDAAGGFRGMDRYEAREAVLRDLGAAGFIEKIQEHPLSVGVCQRCKSVVEPLLSLQWFMKMESMARTAASAVEDGRLRVLPESGKKKYLNWLENIHDWCISRQLWWGHRIPVWYCDVCCEVIAARETPDVCRRCGAASLREETDVLDTWFSSALWPFATLEWPDEAPDLKRFYPNDLMIMGEDILFFWGARMVMMGMKLTGEVPFRTLYIHALVRDAERQKMSKTKGNVLDPLEVTEKYGTDAVRFALAISAAPGTDIAFSDDKTESYRAFANKIWNAGRFILMNLAAQSEGLRATLATLLQPVAGAGFEPAASDGAENSAERSLASRWIFSRLAALTQEMEQALADFRFHEAAYAVYHFFWHELCDWYLEWLKPEITQPAGAKPPAAYIDLLRIFGAALRLLHPFMPFITEELWHQLPRAETAPSISLAEFRRISPRVHDPVAERDFEHVRELVVAIRNARAERGVLKEKPSVQVASDDLRRLELFRSHQGAILRLAGARALNFTRGTLSGDPARVSVSASVDLKLFHEQQVDAAAEQARLEKERTSLERSMEQARRQLDDENFRSRAPQPVVRGVEKRYAELAARHAKVLDSLERLDESRGKSSPVPL
ncbi:MAG: valine--tRNA ligase [Terriglobia bacterium]